MVLCPSGHESATTDFCDVCGTQLDEVSSPVAAKQPAAPPAEPCPACGAPRGGRFCEACGHDFAGPPPAIRATQPPPAAAPPPAAGTAPGAATAPPAAGSSPGAGQPAGAGPAPVPDDQPRPAVWLAVVAADPDYYRAMMAAGGPDAAAIQLPAYCPERRFTLSGPQVRIGRRSVSRGLTPEIDLSGPPEDPGVSHLHCVLLARPDGGWSLVDPGSTNGTTLNDDPDPIQPDATVPLSDGDRIHVGAWTTITLHAQP